jgi:hypothetical protein
VFFGYFLSFPAFCRGVARRFHGRHDFFIVHAFKPVSGSQAVAWQSDRRERYERLGWQRRISWRILSRGHDAVAGDRSWM